MKFFTKLFFPVFLIGLFFVGGSFVVYAAINPSGTVSGQIDPSGTVSGQINPSGTVSGNCGFNNGIFTFCNTLNINSICGLIKQLLSVFLTIGTPIAVLFLVYAGFLFVIARGNSAKLNLAKSNFVHVVLGIAIFLGAWLMGQVIANTINAIAPGTVNLANSCN